MSSLDEIYKNIESQRISRLEQERNYQRTLFEQQEKKRVQYVIERERMYERFAVANNNAGQSGGSHHGTQLNLLTGFEDWYLVTKETHELLKTKETSEQLKVVETPNFLLTETGEIITTKETHEPIIY